MNIKGREYPDIFKYNKFSGSWSLKLAASPTYREYRKATGMMFIEAIHTDSNGSQDIIILEFQLVEGAYGFTNVSMTCPMGILLPKVSSFWQWYEAEMSDWPNELNLCYEWWVANLGV